MTIATDEALQMLAAGWTVRYCKVFDSIEWRTPGGISSDLYHSDSLDNPPLRAVMEAREAGDIVERPRAIAQ